MSQLMKVKIMNEKQPIKIKATSNFPTVNVGGTTDHSKLKNLDYAHSGHTGFASSEDIPTKVSQLENDKGYIDNSVSNLINYELKGKTGTNLGVSIDNTTYVMTIDLKNTAGDVISTGSVDLPLESMVIGASYDDSTKEIVLTLQSGEEVRFSVADLVSGLVSQTDFDTAMTNIDEAFDTKFDLPYYFEYDSSTADYEDTTETTLALFNQLREEMEAGKKPCIIIRKGAVGANAYQTYHFVIPQFGTLDTAYIILKGSPIRSDGNVFNVVALNCERDPETGVITKVYEKKDEGSFEIGGGEMPGIYNWVWDDTSEKSIALFQKVYDEYQKGNMLFIMTKDTGYYKYSYNLASLYFFKVSNGNGNFNIIFQNTGFAVSSSTIGPSQTVRNKQVFCTVEDNIITNVTIYPVFEEQMALIYTNAQRQKFGCLSVSNSSSYTPTKDYHPATKKYVDDSVSNSTSNVLTKDNTEVYTPTTPYNPATKHYVDEEHYKSITNYDGDKKQMLVHEGGVFVWEDIVS